MKKPKKKMDEEKDDEESEILPTTPPPPPPKKEEAPAAPAEEPPVQRRSTPSHAPSKRDSGRHKIYRPTPPEGTAIVIDREQRGARVRGRAMAGLASAAFPSCDVIR